MKLVYIAGPYGDSGGYLAIDRNIARAREAAAWCAENGIGFLCPHLNSAHFEAITPAVPVEFWYELDLRLMATCDALLVLDGWWHSTGTQREILHWQDLKRPEFLWDEKAALLEWAK